MSSSETWDPNAHFKAACKRTIDRFPQNFPVNAKEYPKKEFRQNCDSETLNPLHVLPSRACTVTAAIGYFGNEEFELKFENGESRFVSKVFDLEDELQQKALEEFGKWKFVEMGLEDEEYYQQAQVVTYFLRKGRFALSFTYEGPNKDPIAEHRKGNDGLTEQQRKDHHEVQVRKRLIAEGKIGMKVEDFWNYLRKEPELGISAPSTWA